MLNSERRWWQVDISEISELLKTDLQKGLSGGEVDDRLNKYGHNSLQEKKGRSPFSMFLDQFKDYIVWILIGAAVVSGVLEEWVDAIAIVAVVILNAVMGFIQEFKAEKALSELKKLSSPNAKVIRGGEQLIVPSANLVPGDIIEIEAGDHIPADSRLVWVTSNFNVQEASLTGESTSVNKQVKPIAADDIPLGDRLNMIYMGTSVASGKGKAVVTSTGMKTELGKIAGMLQVEDTDITPLQRKLDEFGKKIVYICFGLVGLVFLLGVLRGGDMLALFLTSVSLAVAAIPEGLPAVVTISLALGVHKMVKRHAIIRKLPAVETLGCASVICSDKTGTLTKNAMTVQAVYTGMKLFTVTGTGYEPKGEFLFSGKKIKLDEERELKKTMTCSVLCNNARLSLEDSQYKIIGDPTEGALITAAGKISVLKEEGENEFKFINELPFDSDRKKMTIIRKKGDKMISFTKGAPDLLLKDCSYIEKKEGAESLSEKDRGEILKINGDLADSAMRVLAVGYRVLDKEYKEPHEVEREMIFLGLIAMIDPPREEVKDAISECQTAGIRAVMITGDHKNTAVAIAKELGFFGKDSMSLSGEELDSLSDDDLKRDVDKVSVYARVSPAHKLRIVKAWRSTGAVVAMTGDGVNDAPAIKEADIGVAMGITGTDVTKEVADMVITDDNFASIVSAVREGRGIYDNIKKFVHYLLSCNAGEILVMLLSFLFGMPAPLLPIHILWVNLVTDGLPALALGVDPIAENIMKQPPRDQHEPVLTKERGIQILVQGLFIAICTLSAFSIIYFIRDEGIDAARTGAFFTLSVSQLFHSFNCRDMKESLFKIGLFSNSKLILANLVSFAFQVLAVYMPLSQKWFKTEALSFVDLLILIAISSLPLLGMEVIKKVKYR